MPRSIIEAMLSGLPVVATNIRGSRELVVDGETGMLVPVGAVKELSAALEKLIADHEVRTRMGTAGRDRARGRYDEADVIRRQLEHLGLIPPI
jgi:glycosyltransferase involved in cell wall biosynthesis